MKADSRSRDASLPILVELQIGDGMNMVNRAQVDKHRNDPEQQSRRDIGKRIGKRCRAQCLHWGRDHRDPSDP